MAYEKIDKQALATMARDRKSKPKVGFWGGLFGGFGSEIARPPLKKDMEVCNHDHSYENACSYIGPNECFETLPPYIEYNPNYSPMVGGNDWDW